jgi:hypothetical protein
MLDKTASIGSASTLSPDDFILRINEWMSIGFIEGGSKFDTTTTTMFLFCREGGSENPV